MSDEDHPFDAYDPKAVEVIESVLDARITPQEGAVRILRYWSPIELFQSDALSFVIQTRQDSLGALDRAAVDLCNQLRSKEARRLAEMNWVIAKQSGNQDLTVQCASTLAQMMTGDPSATRERLALLEFAVPLVVESYRADYIKAAMLANLADARFTEAGGDAELLRTTIDACEKALALNAPLEDFWLGRLNFVAGSAYNTIGGSTKNLQASIDYLKAALKHYRSENYPDEYGSTLNNLGNSYRDLGEKIGDRNLLSDGLASYEKALPFRKEEHLRLRTLANMVAAEDALAALNQTPHSATSTAAGAPATLIASQEQKQLPRFRDLLRVGDDALQTSRMETEKQDLFRQRAAAKYAEAMATIRKIGGPKERAEGFHRLAALFLDSTEDDALWTGFSFASTAQRLGKERWSALGLARVACHRGQMLMKIGYPRRLQYLLPSESLLRNSIAALEQFGQPGEAEQARKYLEVTDSLLAVSKVSEAKRRVAASYSQKGSQRLKAQAVATPPDQLHKAYQTYLTILQETASTELGELLGRLGLEEAKAKFDDVLDEFNRARQLIEVAAQHREIGDLEGALALVEDAEDFAQSARYSAPLIWCQLAEFYTSLPSTDEAHRSLQKAEQVMSTSVDEDEYVPQGDKSGRWMREYGMETYQAEIDKTCALINQSLSTPHFDPARTAELLVPGNTGRRRQLEQTIKRELRRADLQ